MVSKLDATQVLPAAFDDASESIRVVAAGASDGDAYALGWALRCLR